MKKPALTFDQKVSGISHVVLEHKPTNLKKLNCHKIIEVKGIADSDAFNLSEEYKQGLYKLMLNPCKNGFCLGIKRLAIPVEIAALYTHSDSKYLVHLTIKR